MPTAREDVAHLLRRAGFGGLAPEIDALTPLSRADIVERLLDVSNAPAVVMPAELSVTPANEYNRWVAVQQWWIERMRTTTAPLQEKMSLFWHGHFTSAEDKLDAMATLFRQNQIFRTMGLGSFRSLTQTVSLDPAMLIYLDNNANTKTVRNENFARELMELFTLGVNQYSQDDIVASAKAWTGHSVKTSVSDANGTSDYAYVFNATKHDTTDKTFFGTTKNWNGPDIIDEILTGAKKPIAARFIANKLWSFLAYPNPEAAVSDAITNAFLASNDLDITALLRAIFNRDEFYSPAAKGSLVRSPTELIVAALRYTGISAAAANPEWYAAGMGQRLFYPPNVAGWPQNDYWISASATWARSGFARNLTWIAEKAGVLANTSSLSVPAAVQRAFDTFGIDQPSAATRACMEQWLYTERANNGWAEQPNLITLMILSPDFQLA